MELRELPYGLRLDLSRIPLELRFVLSLLKRGSSGEAVRTDCLENTQMVDWDLFLTWIARHKVGPPVFAILWGTHQRLVPDHVLQHLRARWHQSAMKSLVLAYQVLGVIRFLQKHGIRALPFKGVCAAQQIYGAEGAREPGDIDLFVSPEDADTVHSLLRTQGYHSVNLDFEPTRLRKKKFRQWAHSIEYIHAGSAIAVDMHLRLFHYRSLLPLEFNAVWNQGEVVNLAGQKVRTLSLEHTLLLLVAHGASHGWSHLLWLYDVAELLRRNHQLDWHGIICKATCLGVIRHLVQGLVLGNTLLNSPIPEIAYQYITNQSTFANLISHGVRRLTATNLNPRTVAENVQQIRYLLRLSPKIQYKWEILWHMSLHPPDWRAFDVPDALFPLYHILRPVLWLQRKTTGGDTPPIS